MNHIVIDLETDNVDKYGRTGNPWVNSIVAIGLCQYGEVVGKYVYPNELKLLDLTDIDLIVGHNLKFDLLFLWHYPWLQEFFKKGGQIWDTAYAEYCLTGQQHKFPALRDIAVTKYNCASREKLMESYWNQGIQTHDIPKDVVLTDVQNDVLDTEKIYLQQRQQAKELNMEQLILLQGDALLATTEMEFNGMKIDIEKLRDNKKMLQSQLDTYKRDLLNLVQEYWK